MEKTISLQLLWPIIDIELPFWFQDKIGAAKNVSKIIKYLRKLQDRKDGKSFRVSILKPKRLLKDP